MKSIHLSDYYGFVNLGDELMLRIIARIFMEARFSSIYAALSKNIEYSKEKQAHIQI